MDERIPSGSKILDKMLHGGYERQSITTIYGPAGSGKSGLCMLACLSLARKDKKIIYVDTENSFSAERLQQIAPYDFEKIIKQIIFLKPVSFEEQMNVFSKLKQAVNKTIGLVIVDTIGMLYRIELGKGDKVYEVNRELGKQIAFLNEITRKKQIPVLIANQVYSDFQKKDSVKLVGGDILKYSSKCLIELDITPHGNRKATLKKHRSIETEKEITFKIVQGGIIGTKEEKGFRLFR